jgi:ABC-type Zn2+ transport system substrate-binding protein/surface adhesin
MKSFKKSNMNNLSKQLLYNKYVLIFIFILAIGNIIQFVSQGDYFSTAILILVGLLTSFFSKNMVVIMIVGMVVANILKFGTKITSPWKEGFDNHDEKDEKEDSEKEKEKEKEKDSSKKEKTTDVNDEDENEDEDEEEEFTTEKGSKKTMSKKEKQKLIESDALDDLRAEMKIGFKRLNQNIDSIQTMGFFN